MEMWRLSNGKTRGKEGENRRGTEMEHLLCDSALTKTPLSRITMTSGTL